MGDATKSEGRRSVDDSFVGSTNVNLPSPKWVVENDAQVTNRNITMIVDEQKPKNSAP